MKKIEIITPQNVAIEYELSGLGLRYFAYMVDRVLVLMLIGFASLILLPGGFSQLKFAVILIPFAFYHLLSEWWMNGQTIGKMAVGIKVIRRDGAPLNFTDSATRWFFRIVDIYLSFGALGSILISSSKWHQRLGDVIADTVVIKVRTSSPPRLEELLEFKNAMEYTPVYMHYLVFGHQEIILAKITLDRARKYKNEAHQEALQLIAQKIRKRLNDPQMDHVPDITLIKGVITDYVMLTR